MTHYFCARLLLMALACGADSSPGSGDPSPLPSPVTLVIRGASVFDAERGIMIPDSDILIAGERIAFVGPPGESPAVPAGVRALVGEGKYVIPGLIDAHVHLVHVLNFAGITGDEVLPLFLAAGVTAVRCTGDEIVALTGVAHFAAAHPVRGPRVFTCSPLIDGEPPIHRDAGRAVTDPAQVPTFVEEMARWNVTTLKIYAGTQRPVGKAVIEEGHRRGLLVAAHLGPYRAQDAVADGIDSLEHIWSVFNYIIPPEAAAQPDHRATLDLTNPLAEQLIADIAKRKVLVAPTLCVFRNMLLLPDLEEILHHPDNELVPRRLRQFWPLYTPNPQATLELRRREFAKYQELTARLQRAGVTILAGTDAPEPNVPPGFSLHQELELLVAAGLSPSQALQAATWNNARALKQEPDLGSLAAGKLADLVILSKNPLDDIRHTRSIECVIRGGCAVDPEELLKLVPRE